MTHGTGAAPSGAAQETHAYSEPNAAAFSWPAQDVFDISPSISMDTFQALLDEAPPGSLIRMSEGTYNVTEGLLISRSDITLEGAGEGRTILRTEISDEDAASTITVRAPKMERKIGALAKDAQAGTKTVTLSEGHDLKVGDVLYVTQPNDAKWLAETGNTGWNEPHSTNGRYDLREQHSEIVSIKGNVVTLAEPLSYTFEAGLARAAESTFLTGVNLKGFTIEGSFGAPNPFDFTNTMPEWSSIAALTLDGVTGSSLSDITVLNPASHGFKFQRTYGVTGDDLTAIGAMNKGDSSNGYHFYLSQAFANDFTNLHSEGARHALLTSSTSAEHHNNVHMSFIDRDVNFHGSPDADNTVVVDRQVMNYPDGSNPQWSSVHPGVFPLHPKSTIDKNDVTFKFARTGERADTVTAHESGGNIATGAGSDRIIGGAGNDTIDGGMGRDTMQGGGGRDTYVRRLNDGDDVIKDFRAGKGGDVLIIRGTAYTSFAELRLEAVGNDTILDFGAGGRIKFWNTKPSDFGPANVRLEPNKGDHEVGQIKGGSPFALGTMRDDEFVLFRSHLSGKFELLGGRGEDRAIAEVGFLNGNLSDMADFSGVDVFDVSRVAKVNVAIDREMADQTDTGRLTIAVGDDGETVLLDSEVVGPNRSVWVDGARAVRLTGGRNHSVNVTDRIGANITGDTGVDKITGGDGRDLIRGGAGNDVLKGGRGNDTLDGGAGADVMNGGPGSDTFIVDNAGDIVVESKSWAGRDHVRASVSFKLGKAHIEDLTLTGTGDIDGTGNGLANRIIGNSGDNVLNGGGGRGVDTMAGGLGDDTYHVRHVGDRTIEKAGGGMDTVFGFINVRLEAHVENVSLKTGKDLDAWGNGLDNVITGNAGDNRLQGNNGNDTLRGMGGKDTFVLNGKLTKTNVDTIMDFRSGEDDVLMSAKFFDREGPMALGEAEFLYGTDAGTADHRMIYDRETGNLWYDRDGSGDKKKQLVAVFDNKAEMTYEDMSFEEDRPGRAEDEEPEETRAFW